MSTTHRLAQYAALAAALPAATSDAGITYQQNLNVVVGPGQSALIDFGAGFGEVFRFEVRTQQAPTTGYRAAEYYAGLFQFNPLNGNGVSGGGFVAGYSSYSYGGSGGGFVFNDPARLNFMDPVSVGQRFYEPMSTYFGTLHDLAYQTGPGGYPARSVQDTLSNWLPNARGFIGFKMFKDGSFHFGWLDVETRNWSGGSAERSVIGPEIIIHGWGFQDEPRVGINAGQIPAPAVGGLAALALGAAGVRRSRRLTN